MAPIVVIALLQRTQTGDVIAAIVFLLAAITDWVDGYLARSRGQITQFGKVMDPIADKLLIAGTLVALVMRDDLSIWVAAIVLAREFAVSGLRLAVSEEGHIISASWLGKLKTVVQVVAVLAVILWPHTAGTDVLVVAMVVVTLVSGIDYFVNARRRIDPAT